MKALFTIFVLFIFFTKSTSANSNRDFVPVDSARLTFEADPYLNDRRVAILYTFLSGYNSSLKEYSFDVVKAADKYDLDWRLLPAISGVESTFGRQIPENSYNAWGWGIYGNNIIRFASYPDAIETISKGLRENYIDRWGAKNTYQIGRFYAASPTWAQRVVYFMEKIDSSYDINNAADLPITL